MRFALRKQEKIKAYFEPNGDEMLNRIKESLTRYFSANRMIEFYVTGKQYDVYHVAFKGFTKG